MYLFMTKLLREHINQLCPCCFQPFTLSYFSFVENLAIYCPHAQAGVKQLENQTHAPLKIKYNETFSHGVSVS